MADAGRSRRACTTADGGTGRCLSDLSDDLLRHILFLAPVKDGAATAVLSRRWRWLWRTSGSVYIDSRSFTGGCSSSQEQQRQRLPSLCFPAVAAEKALAEQKREAFFHGAVNALAAAAAHGPIRRLTFSIAEDSKIILLPYMYHKHNLMEALVSDPAARRVEELQFLVRALNTRFTLSFGSLPSEALRVLHIVNCSTLTAGAAASTRAFPMLVHLQLEDCSVPLVDLQSAIDAAPLLSKLHLASTYFSAKTSNTNTLQLHLPMRGEQLVVGRLRIPSVSDLVLAGCRHGYASLELDVPRLQCFRYSRQIEHTNDISLKSQVSLVHVDLCFAHDARGVCDKGRTPTSELFWPFIRNFNTTKHLKLRMACYTTGGLAGFTDKARQDELLGGLSFSTLEQLELEAETQFDSSMVMLADLLHCCPVVRDLHIKLFNEHRGPWNWIQPSSIENAAGVQFNKSVSGFRNRRRRSMVSLFGQENDKYQADGIIPGLMTSEQPFSCLQSHLKRVSLHFCMDDPNCLGVKLAKFFAENAKVLQEMRIDDGSQEMLDHVNSSVRRWIANPDKVAITN